MLKYGCGQSSWINLQIIQQHIVFILCGTFYHQNPVSLRSGTLLKCLYRSALSVQESLPKKD